MANTVDKVLKIAEAEVGYLEKSSAAYNKDHNVIYEKTGGAGSSNITKFGKEMHKIYPEVMDFPAAWCDAFVDWCFYKAYGVTTAKSLLGGNFDDYTVASALMYQKHKALDRKPSVGAQIFFAHGGSVQGIYHTGLVYKVDGLYVYTIEGNTSGGPAVVANGGGVFKKQYTLKSMTIQNAWFGHPKYDVVKEEAVLKVKQYAGVVTVNTYLSVRKLASAGAPEVTLGGQKMRLPKGMVVSIEEEANGWGKLTGVDGWVSLHYIKK